MLRPGIVLALVAALGACGGDDGGPAVCEAPDPEALCPDEFAFEAFVGDLETGASVFEASVTDRLDDDIATTSAPNGRAVLCLPDGDREVVTSHADYLTRIDVVTSCAAARAVSAGQAYPIGLLSAALLADSGVEADDDATQVLVTALRYPGGEPITDASVELDAEHDDVVMLGDTFLLPNATGGDATVELTADADCTGPDTVPLVPGAIVGVFFACE
ncbi:MAG TPA: hypothetical protein VMZ28_07980 [Kofleriaceae bacterium]|nr:hypothetical protein [Kofleriaceae bacterium]